MSQFHLYENINHMKCLIIQFNFKILHEMIVFVDYNNHIMSVGF